MFTDIEFENGQLILGLRDRTGDQAVDFGANGKRTAGDTIRACGSFGSWTLESNGRCGGTGTAPQATGQGPGNGEYYHQDDFCSTPNGANYHDEVSWGALLYIPGRQHVLSTVLDPISRPIFNNGIFDGGFRYFNNTTGNSDRAYRVYDGTGTANVPDFGKANGLGGTAALCSKAPIEIGNRIWVDSNANGVQDPAESRASVSGYLMSGVTVRLYSAGVLIATALTDQDGEYYFSSAAGTSTSNVIYGLNLLPNTAYQIRFDNPSNYLIGGPLFGLALTTADVSSQNGIADSSDSDAVSVVNPVGSPAGTFPVISLTTGPSGSNDHTYDAGFMFSPSAGDVSVEGRVRTADGSGIRNVRVTLVQANGEVKHALTGTFGYYRFENVRSGQTVLINVAAKQYTFPQPTITRALSDDISEADFIANESGGGTSRGRLVTSQLAKQH